MQGVCGLALDAGSVWCYKHRGILMFLMKNKSGFVHLSPKQIRFCVHMQQE